MLDLPRVFAVAGMAIVVGAVVAAHAQAPRTVQEELARWDRIFETEPDRIRWEPNAFLKQSVISLPAGDALDVGMGSGRNALFLARLGWRVTGIDNSKVGVSKAKERATSEKLLLTAVEGDMFAFDYGEARYDLVLFLYMGPIKDLGPRLVKSLKPGGHLLIEHYAGGFESGSLPIVFPGLEVIRYVESLDFPDYDLRQKSPVVRFLARKPRI